LKQTVFKKQSKLLFNLDNGTELLSFYKDNLQKLVDLTIDRSENITVRANSTTWLKSTI